jgi:hypothetical protein
MKADLDGAINTSVAGLARACLAASEADAQRAGAGAVRDVRAALRRVDGGFVHTPDGREFVDREKLRWLIEQIMHRLTRHIDSRLARRGTLGKETRAELANLFEDVMRGVEETLLTSPP